MRKIVAGVGGSLLLFIALLAVTDFVPAVHPTPCPDGADDCPKILFIGNSYTWYNDLPGTFELLAAAGGHPVSTASLDEYGKLGGHSEALITKRTLDATDWDLVVLQEQSLFPMRNMPSDSMAGVLIEEVRERGARPLMFMTPARNTSWDLDSYRKAQEHVARWYNEIGEVNDVEVAPVGLAWLEALRTVDPELLWDPDGTHPAIGGTYLHACVFYAAVFRESPVGVDFTGGLSRREARTLQRVAAKVVLG